MTETEEILNELTNNGIRKVFDSLGYECGYLYEKLPKHFDLLDVDSRFTEIISQLLTKIVSEDNRETGYMAKINGNEIVSSPLTMGSSDGEHIRFDMDDFLGIYRIDGVRKREKLLYDIHTHEVADIGPSPRDLTSLFKEVNIFGCHFSLILTKSRLYLLVRTAQTPSMKVADAVKHVEDIQAKFERRFSQEIKNRPNFIATKTNKNQLLSEVNDDWLPEVCRENAIGLYQMNVGDFVQSQELKLERVV
jgi:hypothetical protein